MLNNRVVDMNGRILFLFFTYIFQGVANMEFIWIEWLLWRTNSRQEQKVLFIAELHGPGFSFVLSSC